MSCAVNYELIITTCTGNVTYALSEETALTLAESFTNESGEHLRLKFGYYCNRITLVNKLISLAHN